MQIIPFAPCPSSGHSSARCQPHLRALGPLGERHLTNVMPGRPFASGCNFLRRILLAICHGAAPDKPGCWAATPASPQQRTGSRLARSTIGCLQRQVSPTTSAAIDACGDALVHTSPSLPAQAHRLASASCSRGSSCAGGCRAAGLGHSTAAGGLAAMDSVCSVRRAWPGGLECGRDRRNASCMYSTPQLRVPACFSLS